MKEYKRIFIILLVVLCIDLVIIGVLAVRKEFTIMQEKLDKIIDELHAGDSIWFLVEDESEETEEGVG